MLYFRLYKFAFSQSTHRTLFSAANHQQLDEDMLCNVMYKVLIKAASTPAKSIDIYDTKPTTGESVIYPNTVVCAHSGVVLLQVRCEKCKYYIPANSNNPESIGHYPYCWVIIDIRPQSRLMLIQHNTDAFRNPDIVAQLLERWCLRALDLTTLGWTFNTKIYQSQQTIWQVVRIRTSNGQDHLRSINFRFASQCDNTNNNNVDKSKVDVDRALQVMLQTLAAADGEIKIRTNPETQERFNKQEEDIVGLIEYLIQRNYRVRMNFEHSGTYEQGKQNIAIYGIDPKLIATFAQLALPLDA
ncbi:MAG: hypothetical protein HUK17_06755, partial [Bacteroidales bacterium]|nr:hypothetical protein [Bacteroidales bacterium]